MQVRDGDGVLVYEGDLAIGQSKEISVDPPVTVSSGQRCSAGREAGRARRRFRGDGRRPHDEGVPAPAGLTEIDEHLEAFARFMAVSLLLSNGTTSIRSLDTAGSSHGLSDDGCRAGARRVGPGVRRVVGGRAGAGTPTSRCPLLGGCPRRTARAHVVRHADADTGHRAQRAHRRAARPASGRHHARPRRARRPAAGGEGSRRERARRRSRRRSWPCRASRRSRRCGSMPPRPRPRRAPTCRPRSIESRTVSRFPSQALPPR